MPPTQTVNVVTSPLFCSSSLESGSQPFHQHHHPHEHDHGSWTSALSSKAQSRRSADAGWVSVTLGPVDEATWQEEAHWMSFHHAIQSLVVSCHAREQRRAGRRQAVPQESASDAKAIRKSLFGTDSPSASQKSSDQTGDSSLARSLTRQVSAKADRLPIQTIHVSVQEQATRQMQNAIEQAEQDEWEVTGSPAS